MYPKYLCFLFLLFRSAGPSNLYELKHLVPSLKGAMKLNMHDEFRFEDLEEIFGDYIIPTVGLSTHIVTLQFICKCIRSISYPSVRRKSQWPINYPVDYGHSQCCQHSITSCHISTYTSQLSYGFYKLTLLSS